MEGKYLVADIKSALVERFAFPTVTYWNRLEGRPRKDDFDRALKAEVRDALWMLTKQWQLGEFEGDDAGWPVFAKIHMATSPLTKYKPATGEVLPFDASHALEATVEQRPVQFTRNRRPIRLDLRLQLGRQWRKMLIARGLGAYQGRYLTQYAFKLPVRDEQSDDVFAHREASQQYAAIAGRAIDGGELYLHLIGPPTGAASDGIALDAAGDQGRLDTLGGEFLDWYRGMYQQPDDPGRDAWRPPSLEYAFACSAESSGGEKVLSADEYYNGHLDWYSFDHDAESAGLGDPAGAPPADPAQAFTYSFIPAPVEFDGMPDTRWWALDDRRTHFGDVKPSTTDLAQLLLIEFGLVFANDWFLVPFRLPVGVLANIRGMAVTNTFGERFWIQAAGRGSDQDWHRWTMFTLSSKGTRDLPADTTLLLAPAVEKLQEGPPDEEVQMIRDEMANMAWGIETVVPLVTGRGSSGNRAGQETRQYHEHLVAEGPLDVPEYQAPISYLAMTTVPENWIPFMPVHVPTSNREVQLQRGRMLRIIDGDPLPPAKVAPQTRLLRQGLDEPVRLRYFVHEEEVPRSGVAVTQAFQRTRWIGGAVHVWLGMRKQVGRGERSSGLRFDDIVNTKAEGV